MQSRGNQEAIKRQSRAEPGAICQAHFAHDLGACVQQAFLIKCEAEQPLLIEYREHLLERRRLIGET